MGYSAVGTSLDDVGVSLVGVEVPLEEVEVSLEEGVEELFDLTGVEQLPNRIKAKGKMSRRGCFIVGVLSIGSLNIQRGLAINPRKL